MEIKGNKICKVCLELNDKSNTHCIKCDCLLSPVIKGGNSKAVDNTRHVFRFYE